MTDPVLDDIERDAQFGELGNMGMTENVQSDLLMDIILFLALPQQVIEIGLGQRMITAK